MPELFNTNDFTGQSEKNNNDEWKGVPYKDEPFQGVPYENHRAPGKQNKEGGTMVGKFFRKLFGTKESRQARRAARKGNRRANGGKTAFGAFLDDLLGGSQETFKEAIEGYIPEVRTSVKADSSIWLLAGAVLVGVFLLKKSK